MLQAFDAHGRPAYVEVLPVNERSEGLAAIHTTVQGSRPYPQDEAGEPPPWEWTHRGGPGMPANRMGNARWNS